MKLLGTIAVHVKGDEILRRPRLGERIKRAFGGEPDLRTGKTRASLEAEAVVDAIRDALSSLGATNAVSLVIDDLVFFHDRDGRPDDLGDLYLAFHDYSAAVGAGFGILRLAVEHALAGLHLVLEVQARTEHASTQAAVRVVVAGRLQDLEPKPDEDAAAYRARVEPLIKDKATFDVARVQFESFVARVRDAIAAAMPEGRAEVERAEAQIVRPDEGAVARAAAGQGNAPRPTDRNYDPYLAYYPSPMVSVLDTMMWMSIFSMHSHPDVVVVNHHGDTLGHIDMPGVEHVPDPTPEVEAGDGHGVHDISEVSDTHDVGDGSGYIHIPDVADDHVDGGGDGGDGGGDGGDGGGDGGDGGGGGD